MNSFEAHDLIRAALRGGYTPEDYLRAATCFGAFSGLPLAWSGHEPWTIARDVEYLERWRERAGVDAWTPGAMLVAAIVPARLPWAGKPESVMVARERWPEKYHELQALDSDRKGEITAGDLHAWALRSTVAGAREIQSLNATRMRRVLRALGQPEPKDPLRRYQELRGLPVTGVFDPATDRELVRYER